MQDEKIIDLYWQRDESAIRETAQKYGRYLTKIAYNILSNQEDSEESVNDGIASGFIKYYYYRGRARNQGRSGYCCRGKC